jgi:two-component system OmpR family response regulator
LDSADPYILIVEDDGAIRALLRTIVLGETDLPVKAVETGKAALEVVSHGGCRLALLDMELPELDGETLALAIQQQVTAPIHILLVSALPEHRISAAAQRIGADGYVTKPFDLDQVSSAIRLLLQEP